MMVKSVMCSVLLLSALGLGAMGCGDSSGGGGGVASGPNFQVTTTSVPSATVGATVDVPLSAANGATPFTWVIRSGSLPPGLSLGSSDGRIVGMPTSVGTFSFQVEVLDATGFRANRDLSMQINAAGGGTGTPVDFVPGSPFPDGAAGTAYTLDLKTKLTGGAAPYVFSVVGGGLPPGISMTSDGIVSGTPGAAGTYSVLLQVTSNGAVAQKGTNFVVN